MLARANPKEDPIRMANGKRRRIALLLAVVVAALMLTWAELAVGIFGTPFAGS